MKLSTTISVLCALMPLGTAKRANAVNAASSLLTVSASIKRAAFREFSDAERATIFAGLRCWQRAMMKTKRKFSDAYVAELDIAANGGRVTPLSVEEIDDLIQMLN